MMSRFDMMRQNYREMPNFLNLITTTSLATFLVIPLTLYPHSGFTLHGESVTYEEYWASGVGLIGVLFGIVLPWCSYLFLTKAPKARHFYLGTMLAWLSISFLYNLSHLGIDESPLESKIWWGIGIWACFTIFMRWYLFSKQSVIAYFSSSCESKSHDRKEPQR